MSIIGFNTGLDIKSAICQNLHYVTYTSLSVMQQREELPGLCVSRWTWIFSNYTKRCFVNVRGINQRRRISPLRKPSNQLIHHLPSVRTLVNRSRIGVDKICLNTTQAFTCCAFNLVNKCLPLGTHPRVFAMT